MIKVIVIDAGGVLYLNNNGKGFINLPLIEFIRANQQVYKFGIVSTTNYDLETILKKDKIDKLFDIVLTSGNTGLDKNKPEIYERALKFFGVEPKEVIFIDNNKENIKIASSLNLYSILYTDSESCKKELSGFILLESLNK